MSFRVVMAQLGSTADKKENLSKARTAVAETVAGQRPDMMVFPEVFMNHFPAGTPRSIVRKEAESVDGPFVAEMCDLARQNGLWMVFGMRESTEDPEDDRVYNTTVMVDGAGAIASVYRKTHLYDAFGAKESEHIKPGDELFQPIGTPFGKIGVFVCYELRFPEIARHQTALGADILIVPSGWVRGSMKEYHWQTLVTARALENTVFMVACDQVSDYYCGRSLVVDPMGVPLVSGPETEALITCDIHLERISEVRSKLPSYQHRRPELYADGVGRERTIR